MPSPAERTAPRRRAFVQLALVLLALLLPLQVAGQRIDEPPTAAEWQRIRRAGLDLAPGGDGKGVVAARLLSGLQGAEPALPAEYRADDAACTRVLLRARLWQLLLLFAVAGATYLATVLALGRSQGLLAVLLLSLLPALRERGHELDLATPVTLFALLALLPLQNMALALRPAARRRGLRRVLVAVGLSATAATATGVVVAADPGCSPLLLLHGAATLAVCVQTAAIAWRVLRRRRWLRMPLRALNRRLWPWVLQSLLALVMPLLLLDGAGPAPPADLALLPGPPWSWLWLAAAALGGMALLLRAGLRLGRRGRITPDLLLLLHAVLLLLATLRGTAPRAALLGSPALAMLAAAGVFAAVVWLLVRRYRR